MQVCVVNARAYEAAFNAAADPIEDESFIEHCILPSNKQVVLRSLLCFCAVHMSYL